MSRSQPDDAAYDPEFNRFEAPKADLRIEYSDGQEIFRQGDLLVMDKHATLPDLCVRCNESAKGYRLRRNLSWHHPLYYILIVFPGLLIYVIVALIVRKTAKIQIGLCPQHRARRRNIIASCWAISLLGIIGPILALSFVPIHQDYQGLVVLAGVVCFLFGLIFGAIAAPPVIPSKIDDRFVWLKKVGPEFLDNFPAWPYA